MTNVKGTGVSIFVSVGIVARLKSENDLKIDLLKESISMSVLKDVIVFAGVAKFKNLK